MDNHSLLNKADLQNSCNHGYQTTTAGFIEYVKPKHFGLAWFVNTFTNCTSVMILIEMQQRIMFN